jgi:hypothetical protein
MDKVQKPRDSGIFVQISYSVISERIGAEMTVLPGTTTISTQNNVFFLSHSRIPLENYLAKTEAFRTLQINK